MLHGKRLVRIVTLLVSVAVLTISIYIMVCGLGLSNSLDFGAGAYYYADIPDYERFDQDVSGLSCVPKWMYYLLFFLWGYLMWRLWCRIER